MATLSLVFQILLLVFGVFLVIAVLLQHGKSYGLSGTIAGGAETFFGKEKGGRLDKFLARATTVIGIIFVVMVLGVYVAQKDYHYKHDFTYGVGDYSDKYTEPETEAPSKDTTAPETTDGETTAAPETTDGETTVAPETTVA